MAQSIKCLSWKIRKSDPSPEPMFKKLGGVVCVGNPNFREVDLGGSLRLSSSLSSLTEEFQAKCLKGVGGVPESDT